MKETDHVVILKNYEGEVLDVILVHEWDPHFLDALKAAEQDWAKTDEDYDDFVYGRLIMAGYKFDILDENRSTEVESSIL